MKVLWFEVTMPNRYKIRLGAAGRKTAIKRHNPKTIYRDLMTCYKSILNEK